MIRAVVHRKYCSCDPGCLALGNRGPASASLFPQGLVARQPPRSSSATDHLLIDLPASLHQRLPYLRSTTHIIISKKTPKSLHYPVSYSSLVLEHEEQSSFCSGRLCRPGELRRPQAEAREGTSIRAARSCRHQHTCKVSLQEVCRPKVHGHPTRGTRRQHVS